MRFDGKYGSRYSIVCGLQNPVFEINCFDSGSEKAKTVEAAKTSFETHWEQALRVLVGQRMTKEYKAQYGIKNDFGKRAWKLTKVCLFMGIRGAIAFWLWMSVFGSIFWGEPFLDLLLDPFLIVLCYAFGLFFALAIWLIFLFFTFKMQSRK